MNDAAKPFRFIRAALSLTAGAMLACLLLACQLAEGAEDLDLLEQQALRAAVDRVAPSVVRIETIGGLERVDKVLFGTGPTTGLVLGEDGYIVSSAFAFLNRPASILVQLADGSRRPARLVATDHNRMLVLLKVDVDRPLVVPEIASPDQIRVGQWAIAVGRTFRGNRPNGSVGIVSAVNRIWGKAIQTDAAVSPNNYGGPLVDVHGRVLGVLAPLSPEAAKKVAGFEWYDSGIGFAVVARDVQEVLPRLERGEDLYPGVIGISFGRTGLYTAEPVIEAVRANSPAEKAGLAGGDRIVEIEGRRTARAAEVREEISRRYAGQTIRVVVLRDDKRIGREVELVARLQPYEHPFLGILPMRAGGGGSDEAPAGVTVRYVYPDSPARKAGIEPGDVLARFAGEPVEGADPLRLRVSDHEPGEEVGLEVRRGRTRLKLSLRLGRLPEELPPDVLPEARGAGRERGGERPPVGTLKMEVPEFDSDAWAYVPGDYDPAVPCGVVVWLHGPGGFDHQALFTRWKPHCDRDGLILVAPKSADPDRWRAGELALVRKLLEEIETTYTVDRARVVVHGQGGGGTLAYLVAFRNRELVSAVAAIDGPLEGSPPENERAHRLAFYVAGAEESRSAGGIDGAAGRLRRMNYPVTVKSLGEAPRDLDADELSELVRWIDMLDRI